MCDYLAVLRQQRGLSARALSLKAGLSPSYINKLEAGALEPSFRAFSHIAVALDLTTAELMFLVRVCSLEGLSEAS